MFDNIHEHTQNSQNLWSELELSLSSSFNIEAAKDKPHPNAERKKKKTAPSMGGMGSSKFRQKRPAHHAKASTPFSIRLTPAEKARLREDAAGEPLGAYIKKTLFSPKTKAAARRAMIDEHAKLIGQVLAMVGSSGMADALTTMALAIQSGTFEDEEEIVEALNNAETELSEIRLALLKALGIRKGTSAGLAGGSGKNKS